MAGVWVVIQEEGYCLPFLEEGREAISWKGPMADGILRSETAEKRQHLLPVLPLNEIPYPAPSILSVPSFFARERRIVLFMMCPGDA